MNKRNSFQKTIDRGSLIFYQMYVVSPISIYVFLHYFAGNLPDCPSVFQAVQRPVDYPEIDLVAIHDLLNGKKAFVFMEVLKFLIQQPVQPVHLHLQLSHTEIQPFRVVFSPITSVLIIYSCRFLKSSRLPQKFYGTARGFCNADTVRQGHSRRLPAK